MIKFLLQKSEVLKNIDKLKFDEKADIAIYSKCMQVTMFCGFTFVLPEH